jgi:hypothetical protein
VAVGIWGLSDSDSAVNVLGAAAFIACVAFAGLCFWNVVRFRRGEQPTM